MVLCRGPSERMKRKRFSLVLTDDSANRVRQTRDCVTQDTSNSLGCASDSAVVVVVHFDGASFLGGWFVLMMLYEYCKSFRYNCALQIRGKKDNNAKRWLEMVLIYQ